MRLIPVIDLKGGLAVHAVGGRREQYRPVTSVLSDTADPLVLVRAFHEALGLDQVYIADLDAIQGRGDHGPLLAQLARQAPVRLLVDDGAGDAQSAAATLARGAAKVIVGAETVADPQALAAIPAAILAPHLVFSLDMHGRRVLSRCPQLAALSPLAALECLQAAGWREVILLDLARVGSSSGVDYALVSRARERFPELSLLVGGGIRDPGELWQLQALGVAGVLVATALHRGTLTRAHVAALAGA